MFSKITLIIFIATTILSIYITSCVCFVGYEQFPGFDDIDIIRYGVSKSPFHTNTHKIIIKKTTTGKQLTTKETFSTALPKKITDSYEVTEETETPGRNTTIESRISLHSIPQVQPIVYRKFNCSENERPFNIGPYEVPTQRDVVFQIQKTLKRMFSQYRERAMELLQDIRQATMATADVEKKCVGHHILKKNYRNCVKQVSRKCEFVTKTLVTSLEQQRADVSAVFDGTVCDVNEMKTDPLQLIKTLAMEQASLEFALPGFLRLLASCSVLCDIKHKAKLYKKPIRHMTDQDLVVRHFLTKKTYAQLLKNPNK